MNEMKSGKASGPDELPVERLKKGGMELEESVKRSVRFYEVSKACVLVEMNVREWFPVMLD